MLAAPFFKDVVADGTKHVKNKVVQGLEQANLISADTSRALRASPVLEGAEAVMGEVKRLLGKLDEARQGVSLLRGAWLEKQGQVNSDGLPGLSMELTRVVNTQVTQVLEGLEGIDKKIKSALAPAQLEEVTTHQGDASAAEDAAKSEKNKNPDLWSKMTLAIVGGLIAVTTVALIQPEPMGTVDLAADGAALTAVLVLAALQSHMNRKDTMERLKNMASTSLVMCLGLGADKIAQATGQFPQGLIEMTQESPYIAAGIMVAMVMLLPGPAATALEWGLNKAGNAGGAAWNAITGKPAAAQGGECSVDMEAFQGMSEKEQLGKIVELVVDQVGAPKAEEKGKSKATVQEIDFPENDAGPSTFQEKYALHEALKHSKANDDAINLQQLHDAAKKEPNGTASGSKPSEGFLKVFGQQRPPSTPKVDKKLESSSTRETLADFKFAFEAGEDIFGPDVRKLMGETTDAEPSTNNTSKTPPLLETPVAPMKTKVKFHRPEALKGLIKKAKDKDPTQAYTGQRGDMLFGERNRPAPQDPPPPEINNKDA